MTLKEKDVEKAHLFLSDQEGLMHCSDLLEDFLATISRMEREYLQAAAKGWQTGGAHSE